MYSNNDNNNSNNKLFANGSRSDVLVTMTPGPGLIVRIALLMGLKCLVVANTKGHATILRKSLLEFIEEQIMSGEGMLKPATYDEELVERPRRATNFMQIFGSYIKQR